MESLQSKSNGVATEEKMPLYNIVKDGHGTEVRTANLDHPSWAPHTGIVTFEALKSQKRSDKRVYIKCQLDRATGYMFGTYLGVSPITKEILWERITMKESESFDLSNRKERHRYIIVSRHSSVEGSPNQFGRAQYREIDLEKKATLYLQSLSEKKRARQISENLTFEQIIDLAPSFGIRPEAHSQNMLTMEILKIAEEQHQKFLGVWDSPDKPGMLVFKRALKAGLIKQDAVHGFTYEGQVLGRLEAHAFAHLTSNIQLLSALDSRTKEVESSTPKTYEAPSTKAVDPFEEMRLEIAKLKQEKEDLLAGKAEPTKAPVMVSDIENNEHALLLQEAKDLGIKGAHMAKLDTLKEKIAEAKALQEKQ